MFNIYVHSRNLCNDADERNRRTTEDRIVLKHISIKNEENIGKRNILAEKHDERMIRTPIAIRDHYSPRKLKHKFVQQKLRFNTYKNEGERINESVVNAKILDPIPLLSKPHNFRKREIIKEIGPEFRFQPKTNSERVIDYIEKKGFSQLQSPAFLHEIKLVKKEQKEYTKSVLSCRNVKLNMSLVQDGQASDESISEMPRISFSRNSESVCRTVMKEMHKKMYFRDVVTKVGKIGKNSFIRSTTPNEAKKVLEDEHEGCTTKPFNDKPNYSSLELRVLKRCQVIRKKYCDASAEGEVDADGEKEKSVDIAPTRTGTTSTKMFSNLTSHRIKKLIGFHELTTATKNTNLVT